MNKIILKKYDEKHDYEIFLMDIFFMELESHLSAVLRSWRNLSGVLYFVQNKWTMLYRSVEQDLLLFLLIPHFKANNTRAI